VKVFSVLATPVVAVFALVLGVVVVLAPGSSSPALAAPCLPQVEEPQANLDEEQWDVARAVIAAGRDAGAPARGWVVAIATGMQESGLRPLPYGDRDSLGVFQQRTAWGPVERRMDPYRSALMFFTGGRGGQRGLLDVAGWEQLPLTEAAQAVQVSAFPSAYATWEPLAVKMVRSLTGIDAACAAGSWVYPLGDTPLVMTAGFGQCSELWEHCHTGQDFPAPTGTPVMAAGSGVVTLAGWSGSYGNLVRILHAEGVATWYAHLSRLDTNTGDRVRAGDVIGLVGATGNTTGPHLHLEVRIGATPTKSGTPIDPLPWLKKHHLL
jgi:hypothetical protein